MGLRDIELFGLIDAAQLKLLCFSESLLMVEENGAVVGKMYCSVAESKWCDKPCICVHAGSFAKFPTGLESGTTITSFVNNKLKVHQELVHEWATLGENTLERKTFLINEGEIMPCKITMIKNGRTVDTKSVSLGFIEMESLVTEATNVILQRLLIQEKRTNGNMNLLSLSYTGKVVKAKYSELGSGWENVKGKQMKTWGIRRTVFISEDEERQWDSLFNKHSRLILRCQPDSPQALIPLWFESIIDFDKHGNFTGLYSPYAWACDVELYSKYAIKKEEITHDHRRYIMDHPEVRALLSDYLQAMLFRKPQDIISFTKQYFQAFLTLRGRTTKPTANKDLSKSTSGSYYDSSMTLSGEFGEWMGEGEDDNRNFYPINPTVDYDGLEKVDDGIVNLSEGEPGMYTENETEDDLIVNEEGKYVRN
ncbi:unnamed protein product [Orchesella dallaii]|uniref:Ciliogenesis-associated TTC17-interacting protein N-terminal domain-containing protein n=1 Tax=Orchesella dallaii TaxID=48710 RepID=A0ABP1QEF1_9HEXA